MDIIKFLSIRKNDKQKWVKYYDIETYKYYNYIVDILPTPSQNFNNSMFCC